MTRFFVTGATGFIGAELCRVLGMAGLDVVAGVRRPTAVAGATSLRVVRDIGPDTDWRDALYGVDVVIHLAAHVHIRPDSTTESEAEFRRVNRYGTAVLARSAARAGVRRFVFVSTAKVNGETTSRPFMDRDPARPADPYARSKWEAEQDLEAISRETSLDTIVLRPPLVYGPGVGANFLALLRLCDGPWPLPFGCVENRRSLIFVGNLASAIQRVATAHVPAPGPGAWLLADGEDLSTGELIRRLRKCLGRPSRLLPLPVGTLRAAAAIAGHMATADRLLASLQVDSGGFRSAFDWAPPFSVDQGLAATVEWYRQAGRGRPESRPSARA